MKKKAKIIIAFIVVAIPIIGFTNRSNFQKKDNLIMAAEIKPEEITYLGLDLGEDFQIAKERKNDLNLKPVSRGGYLSRVYNIDLNETPDEEEQPQKDNNILDVREPEESEFGIDFELEEVKSVEINQVDQDIEIAYNSDFDRYAMHDIPMPIEHQKFLYQLCKENDLDYIKTLAILKHESQFQSNLTHKNKNGTTDYGYMQINTVNVKDYSQVLGLANNPLDPYINLRMGVHALSTLKGGYEHQGQSGRQLYESVQSAYNKGVYGYKKHGKATRYIQRTDNELAWIKNKLGI